MVMKSVVWASTGNSNNSARIGLRQPRCRKTIEIAVGTGSCRQLFQAAPPRMGGYEIGFRAPDRLAVAVDQG
jgi:hypothetical protein